LYWIQEFLHGHQIELFVQFKISRFQDSRFLHGHQIELFVHQTLILQKLLHGVLKPVQLTSRDLQFNSRFKIRESRFKIQDSRFKIQDSRFKIQDS